MFTRRELMFAGLECKFAVHKHKFIVLEQKFNTDKKKSVSRHTLYNISNRNDYIGNVSTKREPGPAKAES